jgi:L-ascorbate metabolism protein UlaG (beta-lactamase superfamily)
MRNLLVFLALAATGIAVADSGEAIWKGLAANPPRPEMTNARMDAMKALDAWIAKPNSETLPEYAAYYQRAVDGVIRLLQTERPKKGARIFQLYSSSVIVQTPSCVFAIDLDQGPNEDVLKTPEDEGVAFRMTDAQVDALAGLIDYSFHTHEHSDHIDYEITQALLTKGKTVVATDSTKAMWAQQPWADKIVTLHQTLGEGHRLGDLDVDVLWDFQWNNEAHTSGTPCNAYVITLPDGLSIAAKGDINCGLRYYGWLNVLLERGRHVDVLVGSPIYWKGASLIREVDALLTPLWLPGHNWEFEHRAAGETQGNACPYTRAYALLHGVAKRGEVSVLSWGECLDVPRGHGAQGSAKHK